MNAHNILIIIFFLALLIFEKAIRPSICRKKITRSIEAKGGTMINITRLSIREETYNIDYTLAHEDETCIAKFNFFFNITWV